ncbi:MAG: peptide deformylase [Candidatus Microgenomates bacterium]|jgi:peptide deformylase
MVRKIIRSGDPRLAAISKPVLKIDKKILKIRSDLEDTLKAQKDPEGVGLAACQIGVNLRMFAMIDKNQIKTLINPELLTAKPTTKKSTKVKNKILEGCLSLPNYYSPITRNYQARVKYTDYRGKEIIETFTGMSAQIIQHEIDHLNGIIFVQRLIEQKKPLYELKGDDWQEVELI